METIDLVDAAQLFWDEYCDAELSEAAHTLEAAVSASVTIADAYTVEVGCSELAGRRLAGRMFELASDAVADADVLDAVGEMANVLAGVVKVCLAPGSSLGLPDTRQGGLGNDGAIAQVGFREPSGGTIEIRVSTR